MIGKGVQLEINTPKGTYGLELIWFDSDIMIDRNEDYAEHDFSIPIVYGYYSGTLDQSTYDALVRGIKSLASASGSAVFVFANKEFDEFEDYEGIFVSTGVQIKYVNLGYANDLENTVNALVIGGTFVPYGMSIGGMHYTRLEFVEELIRQLYYNDGTTTPTLENR
ncbi:hypothetical protein [Alkaliphilus serpentinus]|uniref:Uncharacterized protein n=1 Tax=Alkaliphilus serpentinus TaxID=1482731 RepID=A0A833M8C8_9FIRM|nr:hypothetical protein [Alkaliphilus serpentinus]KAB3524968.1 hypothetical protein F8153_15540 [Alkaliphilus serpentinus]